LIPYTPAEHLLDAAKVLAPRCIDVCETMEQAVIAKLALDFAAKKPLAFQAIVESWDLDRIVRELRT